MKCPVCKHDPEGREVSSTPWVPVHATVHPLDGVDVPEVIALLAHPPAPEQNEDPTDYYGRWWHMLVSAATVENADPLKMPIPCDIKFANGIARKGCELGVVQARINSQTQAEQLRHDVLRARIELLELSQGETND